MARQFAIVTGASSGIGLSLAKELAARGYDLAICSSGDRLPGAADELRARDVQVTEVQADLATPDGVKKLWNQVQTMGRNIDVACLNAGVGVGGLFAETDLDAELNMVHLNCAGYGGAGEIRGSTYALEGSHIINTRPGIAMPATSSPQTMPRLPLYLNDMEIPRHVVTKRPIDMSRKKPLSARFGFIPAGGTPCPRVRWGSNGGFSQVIIDDMFGGAARLWCLWISASFATQTDG
jgi:hypothetical protein